jgi:hypothetical protein
VAYDSVPFLIQDRGGHYIWGPEVIPPNSIAQGKEGVDNRLPVHDWATVKVTTSRGVKGKRPCVSVGVTGTSYS